MSLSGLLLFSSLVFYPFCLRRGANLLLTRVVTPSPRNMSSAAGPRRYSAPRAAAAGPIGSRRFVRPPWPRSVPQKPSVGTLEVINELRTNCPCRETPVAACTSAVGQTPLSSRCPPPCLAFHRWGADVSITAVCTSPRERVRAGGGIILLFYNT